MIPTPGTHSRTGLFAIVGALALLIFAISARQVRVEARSGLPDPFAESLADDAMNLRIVSVDEGVHNPAISPDGSTIAVAILGTIWTLSPDGGEAVQLTFGGGWDHRPAWSPDGRHLAFVRDSPASSQIILHTLATGTSRMLHSRSPGEVTGRGGWGVVFPFGDLAFHPTNGRLYFIDFRQGVRFLDPNDPARDDPELYLPGSGRLGSPGITESSSLAFSPDGRSVVIERDTTDLWTDLHVSPSDTADFTQITTSTKARRTDVTWLPGGESIVYLELAEGRESIVIQDADVPARTRRIELGPFSGRELTLYPDGNRGLLVSARRLVEVNLGTGALTPVPFEAEFRLLPRAEGDLVITNARLFDATGSDVVEGATVEARDGVIVAVSTGPYEGGSGARVIDAGGRFLMPGLVESHGHVQAPSKFGLSRIPLRGITTMFDAGSYPPETLNLRDAINLGLMEGPHIYTAGPTIDGPEGRARPLTLADISAPEDARALVRQLAELGVDAIKTYAFLEPEVVGAVIEEAHDLGLPVFGDLVNTSWSAALELGIDGFVHVMDHKWRFISEDQPDPAEGPWAVVEPDSLEMNAFFAQVAEAGAMFDPTVMASSRHFTAEEFGAALEAGAETGGEVDEPDRAGIVADVLRTMNRHGVRWVAGTDAGASSLIEELEIYETIGIPNATILQTATANAALWLGKDDFGTVELGKRADLILVDGNPLERIRDLENVVLVVKEGRVVLEADG